jgi:hypothetical protein
MRSNPFERQKTIEQVKLILARKGNSQPATIVDLICVKFKCERTTAYEYLRAAKTQILEATKISTDQHIRECLIALDEIITEDQDNKTRLKALETKIKLLGLAAVKQVHITVDKPMFDPALQKQLLTNQALQHALSVADKLLEKDESIDPANAG